MADLRPPSTSSPLSNSTFPILALPAELRLKIFAFALFTNQSSSTPKLVLYDSRHGRSNEAHASIAILLTNKQIHNEARPLLYDNPIYQINFTTSNYPFLRPNSDHPPPTSVFVNGLLQRPRTPPSDRLFPADYKPPFCSPPWVIHPETFRRLRWIEFRTTTADLWSTQFKDQKLFSPTGNLLCEVLRCLGTSGGSGHDNVSTGEGAMKKGLRLVVEPDRARPERTGGSSSSGGSSRDRERRERGEKERIKVMRELVDAVRLERDVVVVGDVMLLGRTKT